MKRFFLLYLTTLFALTTWAYDFFDEASGFYYNILEDATSVEVTYSAYQKVTETYTGDMVIPSSVENNGTPYTVLSISDYAFYSCAITSITLPETITNIGESAFQECSQLKELTIPYGVTQVADGLCNTCTGLTSVIIPNTVTSIGIRAFNGCSSLKEVIIPESVNEIGMRAFVGCSSLSKIYFLGSTPPSFGTGEFMTDTETIYVPIGALEAYTTALSGQTYTAIKEFAEIDIVVENEEGGYATFYHGTYDITLPDGVKAYYASEVQDGVVTLTEVTETIPAGNAVLVEGNIADYYMDAAAATSTTTLSGNMLYGSDTDTTTSVNGTTEGYYFYKLSTVEGENLGFYWGAEDGGKFSIAAHKAWLAVPTAEGTRALSFKKGETDTTGITSVEVENEANAVSGIYTLQGIRVSDMSQKGVYIVNGKKVLVK